MNRRHFGLTLLNCLALRTIRADQPADTHDLASCLSDRASAAAVGTAYLRRYPEHASRAVLLDHLALPDGRLSPAQIAAAIERGIRSDFKHRRTVVLDRWLLSRTEAAVCGLLALA
jgi:hypothetical protein